MILCSFLAGNGLSNRDKCKRVPNCFVLVVRARMEKNKAG